MGAGGNERLDKASEPAEWFHAAGPGVGASYRRQSTIRQRTHMPMSGRSFLWTQHKAGRLSG